MTHFGTVHVVVVFCVCGWWGEVRGFRAFRAGNEI